MMIRGLNRLFSFTGWPVVEITFSPELVQVNLAKDRR